MGELDRRSMCSIIASDLPKSCKCADFELGGRASCEVDLLGRDTIAVNIDIEPCSYVAHMDLSLTESMHGIHKEIAGVAAGSVYNYPVPGVSVPVPRLGNASVVVSAAIDGNAEHLSVKVGLDACGEVRQRTVCASRFMKWLPIDVVNGSWKFGDLCSTVAPSVVV